MLRVISKIIAVLLVISLTGCNSERKVVVPTDELKKIDMSRYFPAQEIVNLKYETYSKNIPDSKMMKTSISDVTRRKVSSDTFQDTYVNNFMLDGSIIMEGYEIYMVKQDEIILLKATNQLNGGILELNEILISNRTNNWKFSDIEQNWISAIDCEISTISGLYEDCIEVTNETTWSGDKGKETSISKNYYAPGIGLVLSKTFINGDELLLHKELVSHNIVFNQPRDQMKNPDSSSINSSSEQLTSADSTKIINDNTGDEKYLTYFNERYGFKIDYPKTFLSGEPPANGDGLSFTDKNNSADLIVFGSNINIMSSESDSITKSYNHALASVKGKITYKVIGDNWYVISGEYDERIFYSKMYMGTKTMNYFSISYPKRYAGIFNKITEHISKSFKPGDLNSYS